MRFCPFCAQETSDDAGRCVHCGRRLGARTAKHAPVPAGPVAPAAAAPPTLLGVGPADGDSAPAGGPTVVGGPAGFPDAGAEAPGEADTVVRQPGPVPRQSVLPARPSPEDGDETLDEDTRLPPPAPGLIPLPLPTPSSFEPPTLPGMASARRGARRSPEPRDPKDRRPVALGGRHPDSDADATPPRGLRPGAKVVSLFDYGARRGPGTAAYEADSPADSTAPMEKLDPEALHESLSGDVPLPSGASVRTSQQNIPALPPPPEPLSAATPRREVSWETPRIGHVAGDLPPIPAAPSSPSALGAVLYLWPVAHGVWARRRQQGRIRRELVDQQRSLDAVLLELGRTAFDERLSIPPLRAEMELVQQAEERRQRSIAQQETLQARRRSTEERTGVQEEEQTRAIAALREEAERLNAELQDKAGQRRTQLAELSRIEGLLRKLARAAELADARSQRAQDPASASESRARGESARGQAEALQPQREAAQRAAAQLDAPIAELTQHLGRVRSDLRLREQEQAWQRDDKIKQLAALDEDLHLCRSEREAAEREQQQRMMTIGTLVNLNRPAGPRYQPLYQQVDDIKGHLVTREAALAQMATESDLYDQRAVQKGLLLLGAAALTLGLLAAILLILLNFFGRAAG